MMAVVFLSHHSACLGRLNTCPTMANSELIPCLALLAQLLVSPSSSQPRNFLTFTLPILSSILLVRSERVAAGWGYTTTVGEQISYETPDFLFDLNTGKQSETRVTVLVQATQHSLSKNASVALGFITQKGSTKPWLTSLISSWNLLMF